MQNEHYYFNAQPAQVNSADKFSSGAHGCKVQISNWEESFCLLFYKRPKLILPKWISASPFLYMFQAITEDAQQILDQMTEIENASKRNITPNTATCQISDYLTTSWPRCFITSLLSASKRLIVWKISTLIGLIELENTLIFCTSEQTRLWHH